MICAWIESSCDPPELAFCVAGPNELPVQF